MNEKCIQQIQVLEHKAHECDTLAIFRKGEQYRMNAETWQRSGDEKKAKNWYQRSLAEYDEYLRKTQSGLVLWEAHVIGGIKSLVAEEDIAYVVSEDHCLLALNAQTGILRWDFQAEGSLNPPTVVDGFVYVGSADHHLRAFDAKTGVLRWDFQAGASMETPVVVDGMAYAGSDNGYLWALDAQTGELRWNVYTDGYKNPRIVDGMVYGGGWRRLWALDAQTGVLRWAFQVEGLIETTVVTDGIVYSGSGNGYLWALDAQTGAFCWNFQVGGRIDTPVVVDGIVYVISDGHHRLRALGAQSGVLFWDFQTGDRMQVPVVVDGMVYAGAIRGRLRALHAQTGEWRWGSRIEGTLAVMDGIAYVVMRSGCCLRALDAQTGQLRWSFAADRLPVLTNRLIYTTRDTQLFAINRSAMEQGHLAAHQGLIQKAAVLRNLGQPAYALRILMPIAAGNRARNSEYRAALDGLTA